MIPVFLNPSFADWPALDAMLRLAYAPIKGRIHPPSFLDDMTTADLATKAEREDFFLALDGITPMACGFGLVSGDAYEVGKIAVAPRAQRRGMCRSLIDAAAQRAMDLGIDTLQLYVRVELTENHVVYDRLGFTHHADFTHPGFDRVTAYVLRRTL